MKKGLQRITRASAAAAAARRKIFLHNEIRSLNQVEYASKREIQLLYARNNFYAELEPG
jgi:hypothetical protein